MTTSCVLLSENRTAQCAWPAGEQQRCRTRGWTLFFLKEVGGGTMSGKKKTRSPSKNCWKKIVQGEPWWKIEQVLSTIHVDFLWEKYISRHFFFCVTSVKRLFLFVWGSSTLGTLHYPGTNGAWRRIWLSKPLRITRYESSLKNNSHNLWSTLLVAENFTNRLMLITGLSRHNLWPPRVLPQWNFRKDGDWTWRPCRYSF